MTTSKRIRTDEYQKLCNRADRMKENMPSDPERFAEWEIEFEQVEGEIFEMLEDGVDVQYLARLNEEGL